MTRECLTGLFFPPRRMCCRSALVALTALLLPAMTHAQMSANPPSIAAAIQKLGPELSRDMVGATMKLYAPLHEDSNKAGVAVTRDAVYGPHARNKLDVYAPEGANADPRPIVIFVHGGGFVRGDKAEVQNVGYYFARNGAVALVMNYRFAPESTWPSGPQDIAAVINWTKANAAVHRGNPSEIFLVGNSAGAMHVSGYVFFNDQQVTEDGVKGAVLISAPALNLTDHPLDPQRDLLYYGADAAKYAERSAIKNLNGRKIPLMLASAQFDIALVHNQHTQMLAELYRRDAVLPATFTALGHNHISIVEHFNTADELLGRQILEFMKGQRRP